MSEYEIDWTDYSKDVEDHLEIEVDEYAVRDAISIKGSAQYAHEEAMQDLAGAANEVIKQLEEKLAQRSGLAALMTKLGTLLQKPEFQDRIIRAMEAELASTSE